MNWGLAKHRGRSTYWPERLKERVSHKRWLHFKGTLTVLPTSEGVCRGLKCVFCNISQSVASKKMNHGFSGSSLVPHQQCAVPLFARKPLRQGGCQPTAKTEPTSRDRAFRMRVRITRCSTTCKRSALPAENMKKHPSLHCSWNSQDSCLGFFPVSVLNMLLK